jgi:alkylated DNA repair dioxygenase AlkB
MSCNHNDDECIPFVVSDGCLVALYKNVVDSTDAQALLTDLAKDLPWHIKTDKFGPQSRPTCYFGDPDCVFSYVALQLEPNPWPDSLQRLREKVAKACHLDDPNLLTACLANHYPVEQGHIPWHYDEVRAHGPCKTVASLSLGGPRRFQLRKRQGSGGVVVADLLLPSGSVLLMQGQTQDLYEHCLPLETSNAPHRISLTFRSIVPGFEQGKGIATDKCCIQTPDYHDSIT